MIKKLTIIGVGLIGGSLARSLRNSIKDIEIVGCGRSEDNLKKAVELNVIDRYSDNIKTSIKDADIIFISTPIGAMREIFKEMNGSISASSVITDAGSTKSSIIEEFKEECPKNINQFVPGHPIAGTEYNGVVASVDDLFEEARVIITPIDETSKRAIERIEEMWHMCGANVIHMSPTHHDEVLAATSHLPHLLAFSLVDTLAKKAEHKEIFQYAAGGFKDFSRIASSNPEMWRDICGSNRESLIGLLEEFSEKIDKVSNFVKNDDLENLYKIFSEAKAARDKFINKSE